MAVVLEALLAQPGFVLPRPRRRTFGLLGARRLVTAQTLSLDVRLGPPGLGSLRVRFAFAI
ncbi:MAG: hypothetical protein EBZ74_04390, partial [Planctomycetia bacterium]|nr:hypothetical protein [Planctomycetia bacterium]